MNQAKRIVSVMVLLMMLAGCTAPPLEEAVETEEETVLSPVPERLSFVAPTFDRDVTTVQRMTSGTRSTVPSSCSGLRRAAAAATIGRQC